MKKPLLLISGIVLASGIGNLISLHGEWNNHSKNLVLGGVVSHHNLVDQQIDQFWSTLSDRTDAKVIVLVGPDHQNLAQKPMVFTQNQTVFPGYVLLDQVILSQLKNLAADDPVVFKSEYSIQIQLPVIYHYFPQVQIVPILFRSDATTEQVVNFAHSLRSFLTKDTVVVASVDFSHYLTKTEASLNDEDSILALEQFDYSTLSHFGPEHLDSDQSLIFLSELMCPEHSCSWEELFHGNSVDVDPTDPTATTSYFSLLLEKK